MIDLFTIDTRDYNPAGLVVTRPSARAIIYRDGKVLLVYSQKYQYYKFPGGGIEADESNTETLIREVAEETGYQIIQESIEEYGRVLRRQKDTHTDDGIFEQENFYYFCNVLDETVPRHLDAYEADEGFTPVWIEPLVASRYNRDTEHENGADLVLIKREAKVLDMADLEIRKRDRKIREQKAITALGNLDYQGMFEYVKQQLETASESTGGGKCAIEYGRFDHTKRVVGWAKRLYDQASDKSALRYEDLIIATIFHDVGRRVADNTCEPHAQAGIPLTRSYLLDHGFSQERVEYICSLVGAHSDKELLQEPDTDPNLILLMEADLLDDMGAQGIVMDCMITEARNPKAVFTDCLDHIMRYTRRIQMDTPMVSDAGKKLWDEKTNLVCQFTDALQKDIEL